MDADKAIAARIKHEGKLDEKVDAHFQCAVLYTSAAGQRRVRVHNLAVPVTSLLANVFRFADMDTTIAYVAKDCTYSLTFHNYRIVQLIHGISLHSHLAGILQASPPGARAAHRHLRQGITRLSQALRLFNLSCSSSYSLVFPILLAALTSLAIHQLILPESFKLFPLYALALMKSKALKGTFRLFYFRLIADLSPVALTQVDLSPLTCVHGT